MYNRDEARVNAYAPSVALTRGAQRPEDSALHIDPTVNEGPHGRVGIDVKGPRRLRRGDPAPSPWYTWLSCATATA